jgi:hypothetical protein
MHVPGFAGASQREDADTASSAPSDALYATLLSLPSSPSTLASVQLHQSIARARTSAAESRRAARARAMADLYADIARESGADATTVLTVLAPLAGQ